VFGQETKSPSAAPGLGAGENNIARASGGEFTAEERGPPNPVSQYTRICNPNFGRYAQNAKREKKM